MSLVQLLVPDRYFVKDPNSTELGKKIVSKGVDLVHELGFEDFTFKKLAVCIDSTEASIYRYFENKLKFLLFLTTLYWRWIDYLIDYKTHFIENPEEKLRAILKILTHQDELTPISNNAHIDLLHLRAVVMSESDKTYLTKQVDEINKEGLFKDYKALCKRIATVISEINAEYPYPRALVSTMLEASHQQAFFAMHLPSLTECNVDKQSLDEQVMNFLEHTINSAIKKY
ncbi:MAG: TetR/AcrR family transcriptional regulator [Bacteroidota bacterium]